MRTPRGGQLTYHGPGQLVGYPIMRVASVPEYILTMERAIVAALADAGVEAGTKLGHKHVGVWVGERKIASVGVHICHGVSAHGFAVNVDNDLDPFSWVVACGLPEVQMTSLQAEGVAEGLACFRKRIGLALLRGVRAPPAARSPARLGIESWSRVMDVGLAIFLTGDGDPPRRSWPRAAEAAGYESLMLTEHTHIPVSAGMVGRDGGPLAEQYRRTHDPFVALASPPRRPRSSSSARASAW